LIFIYIFFHIEEFQVIYEIIYKNYKINDIDKDRKNGDQN